MEPYWLGHRDRLRKRAELEGLDALKPHEMLELVLFYAVPRVDMSQVARDLMDSLGSVTGVLSASREQLLAVPGMTPAAAQWVMLTGELVRAYSGVKRKDLLRMWRFRDVLMFLGQNRKAVRPPATWMIYIDYDFRMIGWFEIAASLYWTDPLVAQEAVRQALSLNARYAVLLLFSGVETVRPEPGEMDFMVAFSRTLRGIGVELLDCVICGETDIVSLNSENAFDRVRAETEVEGLHERYSEE